MVTVARLELGDVPEGEAAGFLGDLLQTRNLRRSGDVHGRVNLFSEVDGLLRLDVRKITALNRIGGSIALATLADYTTVRKNDMVATLKLFLSRYPAIQCLKRKV